jgi:hypothetical protein
MNSKLLTNYRISLGSADPNDWARSAPVQQGLNERKPCNDKREVCVKAQCKINCKCHRWPMELHCVARW